MSVLAIDFGTSRIKAAYWNDKRGEAVMLPLGDGGRLYVPSLFYVNRDGKIRFGDEAKAMLYHDPQGVVENLKLKLGKPLQNLPNNRQAASSGLMALLFRNIIQHSVQEVREFSAKPPKKIVLTYPALLDYTTIYKDSLRAAGYQGEESYIREPEAAGWAWVKEEKREPGEVLVVLDFGGGTVDWATLCVDEKRRPRMVADLPASGITAAGVDVDQGLFDEMLKHVNEGQKSYAIAHRPRVIEQIRQMKESQNGRSLLSGKESRMLEVQLSEKTYLFDRNVFEEVIKRELLDQALVSIEGYLKKVVKYQHENGGRKQIWCVLVGGTRLLSGLEEQVKQRVKETGQAGGIEIKFAEIAQADFATVRGAVSQFFAVDEKIPTPEVITEKERNSKAPVAEPITQPDGNNPDKRNSNNKLLRPLFCRKCGIENVEEARYCKSCGTAIHHPDIMPENNNNKLQRPMFCQKCGIKNVEEARYCKRCGTTIHHPDTMPENVNSEPFFKNGFANHFVGIEAVGGQLFLGSNRLFFKSHSLNIQTHELEIPLSQIVKTEKASGITGFNRFNIYLKDGTIEKFVVYNREDWIRCINAQI